MRDPFESGPVLRLGDAKAKPREIPESANEYIDAKPFPVETVNCRCSLAPVLDLEAVEPRPPSLDPAFGDAFGAALSKPRTRGDLVDWIEEHGVYDPVKENLALEVERMMKAVAESYAVPAKLLKGPDPAPMTATQKAELDLYFARLAEFRGANHAALVAKKDGPK